MKISKLFGVLAGIMLLVLPILAQDATPILPAYAVVTNEQLQLVQGDTVTPISNLPAYQYNAVWSADGSKLAYTVSAESDDEFSEQKTIVVYDVATGSSTNLVTDKLAAGFPISWTADGTILYLVDTGEVDSSDNQGGMTMLYSARVIQPVAGATPDTVFARVPVTMGCGGGSPIPMDWLISEESDFGGSLAVLQLTDYGIVHSAGCAGQITSLTRPFSGETTVFAGGTLTSSAVSPDGQKVAGIAREMGMDGGILTVIDLATLEETRYETAGTPYAIAWGNDGRLYYSTRDIAGNLLANLTDEQLELVNEIMGVIEPQMTELPIYESAIYMRDMSSATDTSGETQLYTANAYTIPRLSVVGDTLFFSEIANGDEWVQAMLDGNITFENAYDTSADYATITLYALNLNDSTVALLGEDLHQFALMR